MKTYVINGKEEVREIVLKNDNDYEFVDGNKNEWVVLSTIFLMAFIMILRRKNHLLGLYKK